MHEGQRPECTICNNKTLSESDSTCHPICWLLNNTIIKNNLVIIINKLQIFWIKNFTEDEDIITKQNWHNLLKNPRLSSDIMKMVKTINYWEWVLIISNFLAATHAVSVPSGHVEFNLVDQLNFEQLYYLDLQITCLLDYNVIIQVSEWE